MRQEREEIISFNYLAELVDVALQDNDNKDLKEASDRKRIVDDILGKIATYFMLKANNMFKQQAKK